MPTGVAMPIAASQPVVVRLHLVNVTAADAQATATVQAELLPEGSTFTQAASFVVYNSNVNIPASAVGTASGTCTTPTGASFFALSTRTNKYGTLATVKDGSNTVFQATDWESPGAAPWASPPHYAFASGALSYECSYNNTSSATVRDGPAESDERCMVLAYFFPATKPGFCLNSLVVQ
jgi:hypothetical protein